MVSVSLRKSIQEELNLPQFPTTTIGSFPQTNEVRKRRLRFKRKEINKKSYENFLRNETKKAIKLQESIDMDVIVHGEFERNDMVEYFGEQLKGFIFTKFGYSSTISVAFFLTLFVFSFLQLKIFKSESY